MPTGLPQIPIGLEYIIAVPTSMILVMVILLWYIMDLKRWGPEGFVFRKCRKKDLPALVTADIGSGKAEIYVGEKDKHGSPIFKLPDEKTNLVDPTYLHNTNPLYFGNGLNVHHYATSQYQPLTVVNALGLAQSRDFIRANYPEFDFLNDRDLMAFAKMKRDHIKQNVAVVLSKYRPEWDDGTPVSEEEIFNKVIEMQDALKNKVVKPGPILWDAAFAMNPVTHSSQDLGEIRTLLEMLIRQEYERREKLIQYVIMFCMVAGVVGIVIYIISMAK